MKKFLSIALVCVMLAAILAVSVSAEQTNVEVTALKFDKQPTIDGTISEEEWGDITITIKANEAADQENNDAVSPMNTYLGAVGGDILESIREDLSYDLWLRWDSEYYYVAIRVHDPEPHAATNTGSSIWNNDCVQMRVDPQGPDSKQVADDPSFDWRTTEWDYVKGTNSDNGFGSDGSLVWNGNTRMINAGFALVGPAEPRTAIAWDMQPQQEMKTTLFEATTYDVSGDLDDDDMSCVTSYEIAMPWDTIGKKLMGADWIPSDEDILGMSLVVLCSIGGGADSYLTWGCGICGGQGKEARQTCGGSNAVVLSAETFTPADTYPLTTDETTPVEDTKEAAPTTTPAADDTDADTADDTDDAKTTGKAPTTNKTTDDKTSSGLPTWAIIVIICAAVAIIVAIVLIVLGKKKKNQ